MLSLLLVWSKAWWPVILAFGRLRLCLQNFINNNEFREPLVHGFQLLLGVKDKDPACVLWITQMTMPWRHQCNTPLLLLHVCQPSQAWITMGMTRNPPCICQNHVDLHRGRNIQKIPLHRVDSSNADNLSKSHKEEFLQPPSLLFPMPLKLSLKKIWEQAGIFTFHRQPCSSHPQI